MTLEHLLESQTPDHFGLPTSSLEGSHVSPSLQQVRGKRRKTQDGSGLNSSEWFARYDPSTSLWKTCLDCLMDRWVTYSDTWPRSATMVNMKCYRRRPLVPRTSARGCSLLPTPQATDSRSRIGGGVIVKNRIVRKTGEKYSIRLFDMAKTGLLENRYPTPVSRDWKGLGRDYQSGTLIGGKLNPQFVEWLMGFPIGWTSCNV